MAKKIREFLPFVGGVLLLMLLGLQSCITNEEPKGGSIKVGDHLPSFYVTMSDETVVTNSNLMGKVSVIVFFNTSCEDCQKELPVIQKLWETFQYDFRVAVVPISRDESESSIASYWRRNFLTMPYSAQDDAIVYNKFASSVIPRIYVSDRKGIVIASFDAYDMPSLSELEAIVRELL